MATDNKAGIGADPAVSSMIKLANMFEEEMTPPAEKQAIADQQAADATPADDPVEDTEEISEPETEVSDQEAEEVEAPEFTGVDPESDEEVIDDQPIQTIAPPIGMTDNDKSHFVKLTPESQRFLVEQEALRTADYQRKTQEVAAQRKEAETLKSQYTDTLEQQKQLIEQYASGMTILEQPDAELATSDPDEYIRQLAHFNSQKAEQEKMVVEYDRINDEQAKANTERQQEFIQSEANKLVDLIPEFKDAKKAPKLAQDIGNYAIQNVGLTQAQLGNLTATEIQTIYKAYKLDNAPKTPVATKKGAPKSVRSRATQSKGSRHLRERDALKKRIKESGKTDDLAALYMDEVR